MPVAGAVVVELDSTVVVVLVPSALPECAIEPEALGSALAVREPLEDAVAE